MFGYFNVVGPELFGMYLESDLILGAILGLPAVIISVALVHFVISWMLPLMDSISPKIDRAIDKLPPSMRCSSTTFFIFVAALATICSILVRVLMKENDNGLFLICQLFSLFACIFFAVENFISHRKLSLFWILAVALNVYWTLYQFGRFEAQSDLEYSKTRYAVYATDKTYVNVILLRSTSKVVLMKAGNGVVMYDRSQIPRI
jgi:hypothetical protein